MSLIKQARQSRQTLLAFRIICIDYRLIGTHEDQAQKSEQQVYESMLEKGYNGPPIAVFQFGSDDLFASGVEDQKVNVEYGEIGVADGHHRFKSICRLGQEMTRIRTGFKVGPSGK